MPQTLIPPPPARAVQVFEWLRIALLYFLSRAVLHARGLRFDARGLDTYWHLLPRAALREHLLESLLYLHAQPPLFNAYVGLGLKLAPADPGPLFHVAQEGLSLAAALCLLECGRVLGLPRAPRLLGAALFVLWPATMLYEHWLFYAFPEAVLLLACGAAAIAWDTGARRPGAAAGRLAAAAAALMLLRAAFHPVWYAGLLVVLLSAGRVRPSRRALLSLLSPLVLCLGLMTKNACVVGDFSLSSWFGANLSRVILHKAPREALAAGVARGELSPYVLIGPFEPLERYGALVPEGPPSPIAALGHGHHDARYVRVSQALLHDALHLMRADPRRYAANLGVSLRRFLMPTVDFRAFREAMPHIRPYERALRAVLFPRQTQGVLILFLAFTIGWHLACAARALVRRRPVSLFSLLFAYSAIYFIAVSVCCEIGENMRFRYTLEPILFLAVLRIARDVQLRSTGAARAAS